MLWLDIISFIFLVQLKLIFIVFLLNIFDSRFDLENRFFSILKNNFQMLVFTLKETGGLNHMILLLVFLFSSFQVCPSLCFFFLYFKLSLKPLFRSASSYMLLAASKISWLHEISVIRLLINSGSFFKIVGGWMVWMFIDVNCFTLWFSIWLVCIIY